MDVWETGRVFFEYLYDGVLMIDKSCVVRYINPAYTKITGITEVNIVGKPITEIRPGSRLQDVVSSGKSIAGALRGEAGIDYTVNMSPIIENGKVIGGISIVSGIDDVKRISEVINRYESKMLRLENKLSAVNRAKYTFGDIVAKDDISVKLKETIARIAEKDTAVVLLGESGTGKELYAQAIHNSSKRRNNSFIAVNCAAFQKELLESELFGYEEGAFTGAKKGGKMGLFEAADKGTVFLDEISEMSMETQGHLLRVLQEQTVRKVGSIKETPIDIRVVAASNKNLEECVANGSFRQDLYYRIAIYPVRIPPLRERREDILPLTELFLEAWKNTLKRNITVSEDAKKTLYSYDWPGNIRELRNAVEFSVNNMEDFVIEQRHLPYRIKNCAVPEKPLSVRKLSDVMREVEMSEINKALDIYGTDLEGKKKAAKELGISLASLYNKIKYK